MARNPRSGLEDREVSLIKGMMERKRFSHDQDILALFTRPGRTVNNGRLSEIRAAMKGESVSAPARKYIPQPIATDEEIEAFLAARPSIDARTGLDLEKDELVIKSREAMLLAVQSFNNPNCHFRSEIFIVSVIISWTYLLLAWTQREKIDYIHRDKEGRPARTMQGQDRYLDLRGLLKVPQCPLEKVERTNLEYVLGLRDEIEHRGTGRIDSQVSPQLQACALNFNRVIKRLFGPRCGLDQELSFAIQFVRVDPVQRRILDKAEAIPSLIASYNLAFEKNLEPEIMNDPAYAYRVLIVQRTVNHPGQADGVYRIVEPGSPETEDINNIVFKYQEKPKYRPKDIVEKMKEQGYNKFKIHHHTTLWKHENAKRLGSGFGIEVAGTWFWYDSWLDKVRRHCEEEGDHYR